MPIRNSPASRIASAGMTQLVALGGSTVRSRTRPATWLGESQSDSPPPNWREALDDHMTMSPISPRAVILPPNIVAT